MKEWFLAGQSRITEDVDRSNTFLFFILLQRISCIEVETMSLERVLRTLEGLGLSHLESEVYVYLAKAGPSQIKDLGNGLRMTKQQLFQVLRSLKEKGIVTIRPEPAKMFSAIAFEELLNFYLKLNAEKAKAIEETKQELIESWLEITKQNNS